MGERKDRLLNAVSGLDAENLALLMALGMPCEHCPVALEKGKCYDKTICFKSIMNWLEEKN